MNVAQENKTATQFLTAVDSSMTRYPKLPKVDYLKVTKIAADKALEQIKLAGPGVAGIKLDIKTKGCSGLSYAIELTFDNDDHYMQEVLELSNGVNIFIEPKAALFLFGVTLDYENHGVEYGFTFINPNEAGKCGCGKSFFVEKPNDSAKQ
jgi:iron-sulfur cluster assembly protein